MVQLKGSTRRTTTDREGRFAFTNVRSGAYAITVSYAGYGPAEAAITVGGEPVEREFRLKPNERAESDIDALVVVARARGQAQAINLQRSAASLRTVVSADALGQIREGNIGDALVRLPGVSVETRAGVQRTATIRGLSPQYNTVTVDGLRMTNVDGNRDIALDSFPSNMLARVQVIKSPTADMSSDAIGGTVDLITPSAFDTNGRLIKGHVGGTYNERGKSWNKEVGVTLADTFGADDQFGVLASFDYFHDQRGYDTVETAYTIGANQIAAINRSFYYDRNEIKDRIGAGLSLDYRPGADTKLFFRALYSYDFRELNQRGTDYRPNVATQFNVTANGGSSTGGRIDQITFYREPKNVFQMYYGGIDQTMGSWNMGGRVAYSKARKQYPRTLQITNSINNVNLTYDKSSPDFPAFRVDNAVDIKNPALLTFRQFDANQVPRVEDEWTVDGHAGRDVVNGRFPWHVDAGFRASWKNASQAQPLTVRYSGLTGVAASGLLETYVNSDFMPKSDGRAQLLPNFPSWQAYLALQKNNPAAFTQNAAAALFTNQTRENADFSISENIYSGYIQADVDIGRLNLLGGVRVERTDVGSVANRVTTVGNTVTSTPLTAANSYTNVLPGLQARYTSADDRLVVRAAATKAISRPPQGDLVASSQENPQANQRVIGNPDLVPAESLNLDLTAEYFLPPLGLISGGVFYKDIDKFVFSSSRIAADGVDERTRVNGEGGKVLGFEAAWVQSLDFLPAPFDGLGVESNFTYLHTDATYPGRPQSLPLANSPKYAFNGILSYVKGPLDIRLSYNRLPKRLESVGVDLATDRYYAAVSVLDLAVKLKVMRGQTLFLNVKNLTDEPTVLYQGGRSTPTSVTYYGPQFNAGLQFTF